MQDFFYEETSNIIEIKKAKTRYNIGKVLSIVSYALAVLWALYNIYNLNFQNILVSIILFIIPIAFFVVIGFFTGKIFSGFYVEYDYVFVSGSIRFSKIIANSKRINVAIFDCKNIEKIGLYDSENFLKYKNYPDIKNEVLSSNNLPGQNKNFYYIFAIVNGEKRLFTVECTKELLKAIYKFTNYSVFEKEVLSEIK